MLSSSERLNPREREAEIAGEWVALMDLLYLEARQSLSLPDERLQFEIRGLVIPDSAQKNWAGEPKPGTEIKARLGLLVGERKGDLHLYPEPHNQGGSQENSGRLRRYFSGRQGLSHLEIRVVDGKITVWAKEGSDRFGRGRLVDSSQKGKVRRFLEEALDQPGVEVWVGPVGKKKRPLRIGGPLRDLLKRKKEAENPPALPEAVVARQLEQALLSLKKGLDWVDREPAQAPAGVVIDPETLACLRLPEGSRTPPYLRLLSVSFPESETRAVDVWADGGRLRFRCLGRDFCRQKGVRLMAAGQKEILDRLGRLLNRPFTGEVNKWSGENFTDGELVWMMRGESLADRAFELVSEERGLVKERSDCEASLRSTLGFDDLQIRKGPGYWLVKKGEMEAFCLRPLFNSASEGLTLSLVSPAGLSGKLVFEKISSSWKLGLARVDFTEADEAGGRLLSVQMGPGCLEESTILMLRGTGDPSSGPLITFGKIHFLSLDLFGLRRGVLLRVARDINEEGVEKLRVVSLASEESLQIKEGGSEAVGQFFGLTSELVQVSFIDKGKQLVELAAVYDDREVTARFSLPEMMAERFFWQKALFAPEELWSIFKEKRKE